MLPRVAWSSDHTLRIEVDDAIGDRASARVRAVLDALQRAPLPAHAECTPAYATIQLAFDPLALVRVNPAPDTPDTPDTLESHVRDLVARALREEPPPHAPTTRDITIPICHDPDLAPDLAAVAAHVGLAPARVAELHASAPYTAAFLGFSPGFAYLSGLSHALATPRLPTPRPRVPAGSVAIGGAQTAVYPLPTPGGWRIIGRTPLRVFDPSRPNPCLISMGDRVTFSPISRAEFDALAERVP